MCIGRSRHVSTAQSQVRSRHIDHSDLNNARSGWEMTALVSTDTGGLASVTSQLFIAAGKHLLRTDAPAGESRSSGGW